MFHYTACGLPDVWLVNGYEEIDTPYGKAVKIDDLEGLHRAIGLEIASAGRPLSGKEIRFLREGMKLSQRALGDLLDVSEITVRKWEQKASAGGPAIRLLRALYREHMDGDGGLRKLVEALAEMDRLEYEETRYFRDTAQGWERKIKIPA